MTSLAALATAWAAFQAATWSGRQTFALVRAVNLRTQATQAQLEGDQLMHLDADLFVAYSGAVAQHQNDFAAFLRARFPPRLEKAVQAWLATHPMDSPSAPRHPFVMPEYRVDRFDQAKALNDAAGAAMHEGARANRTSDSYTLETVLLATIVLVAGVGLRARMRRARRIAMWVSTALLSIAVIWLALRPVSWIGVEL
jgi:hypothetical protein